MSDHGFVRGMCNYTEMLLSGDVVALNKEEGTKYYKMTAEAGCGAAIFHLADHDFI